MIQGVLEVISLIASRSPAEFTELLGAETALLHDKPCHRMVTQSDNTCLF
jgi:hypothetical protein